MPRESEQERHVRLLFAERFRVTLRRLPEDRHRTADYELVADGERVAVVEVKTIELTPRTEECGWSVERSGPDGCMYFATKPDNGPKRVASHIHSAAGQLSGYAGPKILVFVNDEIGVDVLDLEEAVRGFALYGTKSTGFVRNTASKRIAEGRIRAERWIVDVYIWIDRLRRHGTPIASTLSSDGAATNAEQHDVLFRVTSEAGFLVAERHFGLRTELPASVV